MVSVINQMLKDLEQRTPEQGQANMLAAISHKPSTIKIVLISLAVLISLNLLGLYIWNLEEKIQAQVKQEVSSGELIVKGTENENEKEQEQEQEQREVLSDELIVKKQTLVKQQVPRGELTVNEKLKSPVETSELKTPAKLKFKTAKIKTAKVSHNQMFVSRRQLTSAELVIKKLVRAEKAIKINDITKAEKLFEDVLIIDPNHKQARKNLAALWFGRKSYQQAINLLSQGIALDRNDAQLRLLKARIHHQLGQLQAAYRTLKPLSLLKKQEYQVMLANIAQQIEQYQSAANAYKILIDMQTYSGRWHLGLAIVYDKNSQFSLATTEYALALTKTDLSVTSVEFAQQRLLALGE